jgi:hypothetical protein
MCRPAFVLAVSKTAQFAACIQQLTKETDAYAPLSLIQHEQEAENQGTAHLPCMTKTLTFN